MVDEIENLLAPGALFGRGDEHRRELLPAFRELCGVTFDALLALGFRELVGLGEDQPEGDAVHAEHLDELQVDLLGFEADVHQHEEIVEPFAAEHIVGDELREGAAYALRRTGVSVPGQIHEIPGVVDAEVVDKPGFAGCSRDFGESRPAGEHVDERRFADVAAADEGDVAQVVLRDLRNAFGTAPEFGSVDLHVAKIDRFR